MEKVDPERESSKHTQLLLDLLKLDRRKVNPKTLLIAGLAESAIFAASAAVAKMGIAYFGLTFCSVNIFLIGVALVMTDHRRK